MSKRELSKLTGVTDLEGSRPKRRRDEPPPPSSSSEVDIAMSDSAVEKAGSYSAPTVKEIGLKLWQTIKDAQTKDGRLLATDFLRKPPRRIYPDYYRIIQRPIALDDIKKQLDNDAYPSMEAVRADFELLFNNAKEYNMKESVIWKDAKELLKLVHKTYNKLVPSAEDEGESDDQKKEKSKSPNLNRLIKSRLQKLIEKTDKNGRLMATEFMELPNRKQWAIYYKEIKKPQCLENIFRRIKRKEYHTAADFAADVELVFSNAMTFNQEHTPIWEDALTLRDYFRHLMSDLPPPHTLPEYSAKIVTNKIKIKPLTLPAASDPASFKAEPSSSSLLLRVPAAPKNVQTSTSTPANKMAPLPPTSTTVSLSTQTKPTKTASPAPVAPAKPPVAPQPQLPAQKLQPPSTTARSTPPTPQPTTSSGQPATFTYSHYSHPYQPIATPAASTTSNTPVIPATKATLAVSNSPAPSSVHSHHQIKHVKVRIQPRGRLFWLDHREGVKTWALRLLPGETGVKVGDVAFAGDEEEGSSDEGEEEEDMKQEEEEEEIEADGIASPTKNGKVRKGKVVRRSQRYVAPATTRTTRSAAASASVTSKGQDKKKAEDRAEVQLKLNGVVMKEDSDKGKQWNVSLPIGSNVLEVGEKGGLVWRVYIERIFE